MAKMWEALDGDHVSALAQICPVTTLSHGHASTTDRGMAIMHMAFLVAGPTQEGMRDWGKSFRMYLGDLAESRCPNIPDLTSVYLHGDTEESRAEAQGSYFFPFALAHTGPSHLLDWCLYVSLVRLPPRRLPPSEWSGEMFIVFYFYLLLRCVEWTLFANMENV